MLGYLELLQATIHRASLERQTALIGEAMQAARDLRGLLAAILDVRRLERDLASPTPGTGLGLYLCKIYAEAMGGHIWVESSSIEGEGSTFFVRLPKAPTKLVHIPQRQEANG